MSSPAPASPVHAVPELFKDYPTVWQRLWPHVRHKRLCKDDAIFHHGDSASALWLLSDGWVKLVRQTPEGMETVTGLCSTGDVFGEAALFPHANYPCHAIVVSHEAGFLLMPAENIRAVIQQEAALASHIMELLNERITQSQLRWEQMHTMSAAQRLGCFLLRLCRAQTSSGIKLEIPVEKHILAAYLGMKPETLSRSQQQLKPLGVHVNGHEVSIQAIETLREYVCNNCSDFGDCKAAEPDTLTGRQT